MYIFLLDCIILPCTVVFLMVFVILLAKTFKRIPCGFFWILLKSFFKSVIISWKNFPRIWKGEFKRIATFEKKDESYDVGLDLAKYG